MASRGSVSRIHEQIRRWANDLIDLSKRNTSLYYRPLKRGTLEFLAPSADQLFSAVGNGGRATIEVFAPPVREDEIEWTIEECLLEAPPGAAVTTKTKGSDVEASLKAISRQTDVDLVDRGLHSLYLCFGMLHWKEADEADEVRSPLLFVPVSLERSNPRDPWRIHRAEADTVMNASLHVALREQFDIELPEIESLGESAENLDAIFDLVRRNVSRVGWTVEPTVVLKRATFHKEAMYRDLIDNIELIAADPLIALMADPEAGELEEPEISLEEEMDEVAPPEVANLILDADASQRRAVHAATEGTSFVMDGPPGSGKSQTIANMIAELMAAGKTVLFVSEKAAALDVVHSRLEHLGLDDFLFELHSHKASRKQVSAELGKSLANWPVPKPKVSKVERQQALRTRERLSSYAEAVNEVREPLGRPAHWVLGRLSQASHLPNAPQPAGVDASLSATDFARLQELFGDLARVWAPVEDPDGFIWRGFTDAVYSDQLRTELQRHLEELLVLVDGCEETADAIAFDMGLPPIDRLVGAEKYAAVALHCRTQPVTETSWWTTNNLDAFCSRADALEQASTDHTRDVALLTSSFGPKWRDLDPADSLALDESLARLSALHPPVSQSGAIDRGLVLSRIQALQEVENLASEIAEDVERLTEALGLPHRSRTLRELLDLAAIGERAGAPVRPESEWSNPSVLRQAEEALVVLKPLVVEYQSKHADLARIFKEEVFNLDLAGLAERFAKKHKGFGKLSSSYRTDKRVIAGACVSGKCNKVVVGRLNDILELQHLRSQVDSREAESKGLLGHFYRQRDPQIDAATRAIETLKIAIETLGREYNADCVAAQLAGAGPQDSQLAHSSVRIQQSIQKCAEGLDRVFPTRLQIAQMDPAEAEKWGREARTHLAHVAGIHARVSEERIAPPTLEQLSLELLAVVNELDREKDLQERHREDIDAFGPRYAGFETDWAELKSALDWSRELQQMYGSPLPERAASRMHSAAQVADPDPLIEVALRVRKQIDSFVDRFSPPRDAEIRAELESSFESARAFIEAARDDVDRIRIWLEYLQTTAALKEAGFAEAVEFCCSAPIDRSSVESVLEKATLAAWVDRVIQSDDRLHGSSSTELDGLVEKFQDLDKRLVQDASELVARACVELRPRSKVGAGGYIEKEAQKKARHMPVRKLLAKTSDVVQRLKPCFMMSPLAVSQYLPSTFRFDVAIFDEASQVRPADAINCFYRTDQVVIAGDERQLPPTSFFEAGALDGDGEYEEGQFDEFESILGQCKGTVGLPALPLRWHYRSQHESLITFSNYRFYDGRLITFPGAEAEAEDLGVKFFRVDGEYRRGGPRDNPAEAKVVAERVLHHMDKHPLLSIGVVAFSQAQAEAILDAIDTARMSRPDLDERFAGDRLDGFFVKSLENVQGDERDIMVFSIGYGPDEHGKFTLNFGPVNREGGWRRLNVAITRARRRVEVVASFTPSEMDTRGSTNRGVVELQRYLDYADRGISALTLDVSEAGGDVESPLEESVLGVLRDWGYEVVPQVGSAGYRIDLGIRDPFRPGRYLLGIECDGAAYHSSKVARDRDRLRQSVLQGLGWRLHRIWGTGWYRDRKREEERLKQAIELAKRSGGHSHSHSPIEQPVVRSVERVNLDAPPEWVTEYSVCQILSLPVHRLPHDPAARPALRKAIEKVLSIEAPIHVDLLTSRICSTWGRTATAKVREAVESVLSQLRHERRCKRDGDIIWTSNSFDIRVPHRDPASRRDVRHIPPEELQEALHRLLCDARLASEDELLVSVRRLFGWDRTGAKIHAALDAAISQLESQGWILRGDDGLLRPVEEE